MADDSEKFSLQPKVCTATVFCICKYTMDECIFAYQHTSMMNKNWSKYRLFVIAAIVLAVFLIRTVYPLFKGSTKTFQTTQQSTAELNRNINNLILTKHARCRMACRDITEEEIKEILHDGNINYNKSDLNDKRGATYALEGYSHEHQHLRIVFAPKQNELVVVTCIDLDKEWQCDCN
jgi:hypothetical protein